MGYIGGYPVAFRNARERLETFKGLLRIAVDEEKTLARKVDAPWEKIKGMGRDKHLAKKIIYCYNDDILPIFRTTDFEDFLVQLDVRQNLSSNYDTLSTGKKYESLTQTLLDVKRGSIETKDWDNAYFMWFLYSTYKGY